LEQQLKKKQSPPGSFYLFSLGNTTLGHGKSS